MIVLSPTDRYPRTGTHADHNANTNDDTDNRPGKIQGGKPFCANNPADEYAINQNINAVYNHGSNGWNGITPEQPQDGLRSQI